MADLLEEYTDEKEEIEDIIRRKIAENKSDLEQVKSCLEERFKKPLGAIDNAFIERNYIEYCVEFWLEEMANFLKSLPESENRTVFQVILNSLPDIQHLSEIPNPLNQFEHYILLKKHFKFVRREDEKTAISRFRKESLEQIFARSNSVEQELDFQNSLVMFLSSSKNLQSVVAELELEDFVSGKMVFAELLKAIIDLNGSNYGARLVYLQGKARRLMQGERDLFLTGKLKEVISAYIKPIMIQEKTIDGRFVIEVSGSNVVLSEIINQLKRKLAENSHIEEVHFVGTDTIHIDANLEDDFWQGRNIAILTKVIKIHNEVTWNLSGKDNDYVYPNNAGTGEDGHGQQGKDGYPGESGGNVLILTEIIKNPKKFTIVSKGGKGSRGQDGGNGRDGEDGKGISEKEFDAKFRPVASTVANRIAPYILKTVNNINNDLLYIKTEWFARHNGGFSDYVNFYQNIIPQILNHPVGHIFLNVMTNQGNEITFSHATTAWNTNAQAYLIYKGSLGNPGAHGGDHGLGGQGGYPGEITARNLKSRQKLYVIRQTKHGEDGKNGKGGLYGEHGKNGWDMGYMDYQFSGGVFGKWPKHFGKDQQKKLSLVFFNENAEDRVWCPYQERYCKIEAHKIEHQIQNKYEERKSTRQTSDLQHHAQATRKKGISSNILLANYSDHLHSMGKSTLQKLQSDLESTKQLALQAIANQNQEQQEKQAMKLRIKRHFYFDKQSRSGRIDNTVNVTTYNTQTIEQNVEDLINELEYDPLITMDDWSKLKSAEASISQLVHLFSVFEILKLSITNAQSSKGNPENSKLQYIEKILIDKYRFATLKEIVKQLPPSPKVTNYIELTAESAVRYIVEGNDRNNNISHLILGSLNQYLYLNNKEQRKNIIRFCKEELENPLNEAFKWSMRAFIMEVEKSEETHTALKKYYDEYQQFLEKQNKSLKILFGAFRNELAQPRHSDVHSLWVASLKDKSLKAKVEEKIQNDNFLNTLYNRFNNQRKAEYDWENCCNDQNVLKKYYDYIEEKGPLSECYRELLTYVFDVNIRLYAEDQEFGLFLDDTHNPSSKQAIHVLCRAGEFIHLNINENYFRLEEQRHKEDDLYANILKEIELLKQKQEFDDYLKNKCFLADCTLSKNEHNFDDKEEEEDIIKIMEYFPEEEKEQLKTLLEKIAFKYVGQRGILHYVAMQFSCEGRHVSYRELCYLINSILTSCIENRKEQNSFCWIVAAHSQRNWIDELILLKLENHFKRQLENKSKWREYLSKIEHKDVLLSFSVKLDKGGYISTQCIEDILRLLSNIPNATVNLEGLELSEWPYILKEKYWSCKLSSLTNWQDSEKLPTASYYLLSMENSYGVDLVEELLEVLEKENHALSPDDLINILTRFHNNKWNLSKKALRSFKCCNEDNWEQEMLQKFSANKAERKITQLAELIEGDANTSKEILNNLPKINGYFEIIDQFVIKGNPVGSLTQHDITNWVNDVKTRVKLLKEHEKEKNQDIDNEMLAVINRGIKLKRGFYLRDTQKLTIMALLINAQNILSQVSTGEGKTLIVVAAAIMKALRGEKVDIITSSSVLAKRDAEENKDLYNLFNIKVSHNCSEDIQLRKGAYSDNQVVYGDLSSFQRDYLLDKFYGNNILGDRNFKNVFVDEVDSMLLDKGNNILYLSHDLAGLDKLESVYIYIWQWINRPAFEKEDIFYGFDIKAIEEAVLSDLYGLVQKEDIGRLGPELTELQKNNIWKGLIKAEILDNQGKLLKENISGNEVFEILSPEFTDYKDRLAYLLNEVIQRERFIHVPNHLRSFVEMHLEFWIKNAVSAFFMKEGQDYVVDVDRTGTSPDLNPIITILDRDTGTDQSNSQWDEALHQFLQLKHGCKLSLQSLKAVFISNVTYFKLYSKLYGLTGTLGSQRERNLLQEIYEVDFLTVPTYKVKQFEEDKPIICSGKEAWINQISDEVEELTQRQKRSVLIICETVNDVEVLYLAFGGKYAKHVYKYVRDYEKLDVVQDNKKLEQGQIIIATNLAGRGTDIKISEELKNAGGLHVCLTYLPANIRIEQQAFGRAARKGEKGSGRLIIMDSKGQAYSNARIIELKKERDVAELYRISDIKAYYETQITAEETCFRAFREQYEQLQKTLDNKNVPFRVQRILLLSCLDKWAFWLVEASKHLKNMTNKQSDKKIHELLSKFILQFKTLDAGLSVKKSSSLSDPIIIHENDSKCWLPWVEGNPAQMVKLGKYLAQNDEHINAHQNALKLFDEVIEKEPHFSEAAHYYKAFALLTQIDWDKKPMAFTEELQKTVRLFDKRIKFAINAAGIIGMIKRNNTKNIIQTNAYEEQQKSIVNLYRTISRSISDILGHAITPQSFVNYDVNDDLTETIHGDLLEKDILEKPKVKNNIPKKDIESISSAYGISTKTLQGFLSKYEGMEINEKEFLKALEKEVQLSSREAFWDLLIHGHVLREEITYVMVNQERLGGIDPSLLDTLQELPKQTLELSDGQILLNAEYGTQQQNAQKNIFRKDDFVKLVGEGKYQTLKERGVISVTTKAHFDQTQIESMTFPFYDSITLEDFTKINITKSEAEQILAKLVEQNIIEKTNNGDHRLKIKFHKIEQFTSSVYEFAVKGLLSVCFAYRITLQRIEKQLEEKNLPLLVHLPAVPHQSLFWELLEQKILEPSTVITEDDDLEEKLTKMYSSTLTKDDIIVMLSKDKLIPEEHTEQLFQCLLEQKWITEYSPERKELVRNPSLYIINEPGRRQTPLNYCTLVEHGIFQAKNSDKTVATMLDNRLKLAKKDTITNIVSTLKRSRSTLKTLKVPNGKLHDLYGQHEFANVEEMNVFFLNGLRHLLQFEEKKWTREMLFNTLAVNLMGLAQIFIGVVIETFSAGAGTHFAAAFISEGVSDLIFAVDALRSGYFGWKDYEHHKIQSLFLTVITGGVGAAFSSGTKVSRFGLKLAGPTFEIGGKKVAEMSGKQLIKNVGLKRVGKEVAKRVFQKASEGITFGLVYAGVDTIVENNLQALCEDVASSILSNIAEELNRHVISKRLEKAYESLGDEGARKMVNELTERFLTGQTMNDKFLTTVFVIRSSIVQGIANSIRKNSKTSDNLAFPLLIIRTISMAMVWTERISHLASITTITGKFLDDIDKEMTEELSKKQKQELHHTQAGYQEFKKQVTDQWKELLREKAGQVISQHLVSPILQDGARHLIKYVGKRMKKAYQSHKESEYREQFVERKRQYEEQININEYTKSTQNHTAENHITEKYHKDLLKLLKKTKNPNLFAAIVQENIPMDVTCVAACAQLVPKVLNKKGIEIPGLTITVEGDDGRRMQEFSSESVGAERLNITLQLNDNRFEFSESSTSQTYGSSESKHNCLFEALSQAIPELRDQLTAAEFRAAVSDHIEHDGEIQRHIQQGWHRLPIARAARQQSQFDEHTYSQTSSVADDIIYRFLNFIFFAGIEQKKSQESNKTTANTVTGGTNQFKDRSSDQVNPIDAVPPVIAGVAAGTLNDPKNEKDFETFPGDTQNAPRYKNQSAIANAMDDFQSDQVNLKELKRINFETEFDADAGITIQTLKERYVETIDQHIDGEGLDTNQRMELENAKTAVTELSNENLFAEGRYSYFDYGNVLRPAINYKLHS